MDTEKRVRELEAKFKEADNILEDEIRWREKRVIIEKLNVLTGETWACGPTKGGSESLVKIVASIRYLSASIKAESPALSYPFSFWADKIGDGEKAEYHIYSLCDTVDFRTKASSMAEERWRGELRGGRGWLTDCDLNRIDAAAKALSEMDLDEYIEKKNR